MPVGAYPYPQGNEFCHAGARGLESCVQKRDNINATTDDMESDLDEGFLMQPMRRRWLLVKMKEVNGAG